MDNMKLPWAYKFELINCEANHRVYNAIGEIVCEPESEEDARHIVACVNQHQQLEQDVYILSDNSKVNARLLKENEALRELVREFLGHHSITPKWRISKTRSKARQLLGDAEVER